MTCSSSSFSAERLREVCVGARLDPALDVDLLHAGREQHDLQVAQLVVGANRGEHLVAGQPRHHHVEDRDGGTPGARELERRMAVVRLHDLVAGATQAQRDEGQDVLVVVGAEDERRVVVMGAAGSST